MLPDQTIAEVSASSGAYRDYLRFTRPAVARQMRAFGLEFEFSAAERDGLRLAQPAIDPRATLGQASRYAPRSTQVRIAGGTHHRRVWCALSGPRPRHQMTLDAYPESGYGTSGGDDDR